MAVIVEVLVFTYILVASQLFQLVFCGPLKENRIIELESKFKSNGYLDIQQIHIAYGNTPQQVTVMWSTRLSTDLESSATVQYGIETHKFDQSATGKVVKFTLGNPDGLQYIHRVQIQVLLLRKFYVTLCTLMTISAGHQ